MLSDPVPHTAGESKFRCTGCRKAAHRQDVAQCDSGLQIQYLLLETALDTHYDIINAPKFNTVGHGMSFDDLDHKLYLPNIISADIAAGK